ncbi:hypothetical protein ACROYT_G043684 [Oculina patagonica]
MIIFHPRDTSIPERDNVTLTCNADGNPEPTISWTRNGYPLDTSEDSRITFSENKKQLIITNVKRTDSGEYRCVAKDSLGNDTSTAATLNIQYTPEFSKHPKDTKTSEGEDIVFTCSVEGNPAPSVRWTRNGDRLNLATNTRIRPATINNTHTLTITDVRLSDAGQYGCVANNSVGSSSSIGVTLEVSCEYNITAPANNFKFGLLAFFRISFLFFTTSTRFLSTVASHT